MCWGGGYAVSPLLSFSEQLFRYVGARDSDSPKVMTPIFKPQSHNNKI